MICNRAQGKSCIELLRTNRDFRKLWLGLTISQAGDWFNIIGLFSLLSGLTGSNKAIAYIFIIRMLPVCIIGPFAGTIADRYSRKAIMVLADLSRFLVVLSYIFVRSAKWVWVIYLLAAIEIAASSFFETAKSASVPNLVDSSQLVSANVLLGISWSAMLAFGAALGGLATTAMGHNWAFAINAITFLFSAVLVLSVRFPPFFSNNQASTRGAFDRLFGISELVEGATYIKSNFDVALMMLVKAGWGLGGGILMVLIVFGKQVFPVGRDGSASIGLLYAARGVGSILGPLIASAIAGHSAHAMRRAIAVAFFACAGFYFLLSTASSLVAGIFFVIGIHAAANAQWVFSTSLLQKKVPDYLRGRILALDLTLFMLTMSISIYLTALGLDHLGLTARAMATLFSLSIGIYGAVWMVMERASQESRIALNKEEYSNDTERADNTGNVYR